jgi:hypothetical protein
MLPATDDLLTLQQPADRSAKPAFLHNSEYRRVLLWSLIFLTT